MTNPSTDDPYEVLGVAASATQTELRQAYRRLMRQTHPDLGGTAVRFHAIQLAWEQVGTEANRAKFDRARRSGMVAPEPTSYAAHATRRPAETVQKARSYGHPGGQARQRFLSLMREWSGRGTSLTDPYDSRLVASAPAEIRRLLATAIAEETTAGQLSQLSSGFTVWHDVAAGTRGAALGHVVLGPSGLFAVVSQDWDVAIEVHRGEIQTAQRIKGDRTPDPVASEKPIRAAKDAARAFARAHKVTFTAIIIVLPDQALSDQALSDPARSDPALSDLAQAGSISVAGSWRVPETVVVRSSRLSALLSDRSARFDGMDSDRVFELRASLKHDIAFV